MTRFMMTLEDAVDLVIYAFENGSQGRFICPKKLQRQPLMSLLMPFST